MPSVQRYKATNGYGGDSDLVADDAGEIVLHPDYTAISERCAGLEWELDHAAEANARLIQECNSLKDAVYEAQAERDTLAARLAEIEAHADDEAVFGDHNLIPHYKARLAAAEEALRVIVGAAKKASTNIYIYADGIADNSGDASACEAAGIIMEEINTLDTILAGHAPATKGEDDE